MVEELAILRQIYLGVAENDAQTNVLKTLAVADLLEIQSATLQDPLDPLRYLFLTKLKLFQVEEPRLGQGASFYDVIANYLFEQPDALEDSFLEGPQFSLGKFLDQLDLSALLVLPLEVLQLLTLGVVIRVVVDDAPELLAFGKIVEGYLYDGVPLGKGEATGLAGKLLGAAS